MENVVGDRVLIAVQAVNISRLSTHPVPTVPSTLIVVAGAGPKDSNGAGKSSFIASITALLGDEQWRFASGAKAVSELLFNAELASGAGGRQWASADHGYIVGVFGPPGMDGFAPYDAAEAGALPPGGADGAASDRARAASTAAHGGASPTSETPAGVTGNGAAGTGEAGAGRSGGGEFVLESQVAGAELSGELFEVPDTSGGALTVWLKVNQEAPHLEIRWREGVHLAASPSEAERVARADEIWATLPKSAGRRDVVARDLTKVLYGDRVRCVSFLSTSVRSKVATNLLSQPLNEISPERVFEAIAALTGLDAELEQEREARRDEHAKRVRAAQAAERLAEFETESKALLTTFDRRDQARIRLADALRCWRGRQARKLADAAGKDEALAADLERHRAAGEAAAEAIAMVKAEIGTLREDTLDRQVSQARKELAALQARAAKLDADRAVAENSADELRGLIPALEETRRFADGRDVPTAERELQEVRLRLNEALKALGVADQEVSSAQAALDDAEGGPAAAQLNALAAAGIGATGLLDALDVAEQARDAAHTPPAQSAGGGRALRGASEAVPEAGGAVSGAGGAVSGAGEVEALGAALKARYGKAAGGVAGEVAGLALGDLRGWPNEHAVIVDAAQLDDAAAALAELPGSVLVSSAGVSVVGAFDGVATGREARIKAAELRLNRAKDVQETAAQAVRDGEEDVAEAQRRLEGARAGVRLAELEAKLGERRARLTELNAAIGELAPKVAEAERQAGALDFRARTRDMEIERLEGRRHRHETERTQARDQEAKVGAEREALKLDALAADWGGTVETAREWLNALPEEERPRAAEEWWRVAERHFDQALRDTFPEEDAEIPEELQFLLSERGGSTAREQATFAAVCGALASYLRGQEEYERHQRRQIEAQVVTRQRDLSAAARGAEEAAQSTAVHRAALTAAIKARLTRVAEEFEKLDTSYGGYGATLEFPVPPAPADPEQRWQWRVTPKWRRGEGQGFVPYNRRANTALMDEKAVKLVCAAAIASSGGGHLCLVLDELGRNLGKEHRREAVALFRRIGETYGITVIGALQDDMEPYAIDACGQYIKLRRSSDAMPYNEPPVIVGHDQHADRVRALAAYVDRTAAALT
ncbi:FtsZ-binding cell division protein ZapB [Nonomuraea angiospora]|uniref:FtsZ-binding cell division protein ZapB n=1 Tax=Nonomuraea angiospora TaxID=46172 RepID=A0ABR9LY81_9ACTN|nr:chromosome partitioning protein ParA [Nonomuraea angiospora]MBE1585614.1 FtsZ-binding cell division protein ZapB [Nonomuraea angiospora]